MSAGQQQFELPVLETARLRLRRFSFDDAPDIFEYASDKEVTRYVFWSPHASIQETLEFLNRHIQLAQNGEMSSWAVEHKADRKIIGTCGFAWWRPEHGKAEIAYAISRKYWNQGLVTEAVAACIAHGFDSMKLNRIEARCMPDNIGSERVMQKCGMRCEGTMRQTMLVKGEHVDLKMYAILKEQYDNFKKASASHTHVFKIEGTRVRLRTAMFRDLEDYRCWNRPDLPSMRYDGPWYGWDMGNTIARRWKFLQSDMKPPFTSLEVETIQGEHIGWVASQLRSDDPHMTEFGIDFPEERHWNLGYGTEALVLWIGHLFRERNLMRLGFSTWSGNPRMIAVGKKLGFSHEGLIRNGCQVDGIFYDRVKMGIVREEWSQRQAKP